MEIGSYFDASHKNIGWTKNKIPLFGHQSLGRKNTSYYTAGGTLVAVSLEGGFDGYVCLEGVWNPDKETRIVDYSTLIKMGGVEIRSFEQEQLKEYNLG